MSQCCRSTPALSALPPACDGTTDGLAPLSSLLASARRRRPQLFWTPALFCAAAFRDDRLVVAHGPGPHKEPVLLHPAELERRPELQRLRPAGAGHGAARAREEPARRRAPSDAQERGGGEGPGDADPVAEACMAVLRARMADLGVPRMQFGTACALLLARVPAIKTLRVRAALGSVQPPAAARSAKCLYSLMAAEPAFAAGVWHRHLGATPAAAA